MNKLNLTEALAKEIGLTKAKATQIVGLFFDEISNTLAGRGRVEIRGLCSIYVKEYKAYTGRNPKTRKAVLVSSKKLPFFKCGKELKERVDQQ